MDGVMGYDVASGDCLLVVGSGFAHFALPFWLSFFLSDLYFGFELWVSGSLLFTVIAISLCQTYYTLAEDPFVLYLALGPAVVASRAISSPPVDSPRVIQIRLALNRPSAWPLAISIRDLDR